LGDNAIYKRGRLLAWIETYQREALGEIASHPLCGPATLSVGIIHGGVSVNTVPDRCTIEIDRRLPPGEDPQAAWQHLVDYLAVREAAQLGVEQEPPSLSGLPLGDGTNRPLAEQLGRVAHDVLGAGRPIGVPYATDAAFFAAAGVPTVVCGPGSIEQAHTDDEWLSIEQLHAAVEVYTQFLLKQIKTRPG
jgi:acetylornithine deacetylase